MFATAQLQSHDEPQSVFLYLEHPPGVAEGEEHSGAGTRREQSRLISGFMLLFKLHFKAVR